MIQIRKLSLLFIIFLASIPDLYAVTLQAQDSPIVWNSCHISKSPDIKCQQTKITVPVNYDAPSAQTVDLTIVRIPVANPTSTTPTLFMNFGDSPWGEQTPNLEAFATSSTETNPSSPEFFQRLHQHFNLVSFNPRGGNGLSQCTDKTAISDMQQMLTLDTTQSEQLKEYISLQKKVEATCYQQNKAFDYLWPYVGTLNTIKDLDTIRQKLGISKINYFGISNGTLLGLQYIAHYPNNVRAMVLDGNVGPSYDVQQSLSERAATAEAELQKFFELCKESSKCAIQKSPEEIYTEVLKKLQKPMLDEKGQKLTRGIFLNLLTTFGLASPSAKTFSETETNWEYFALAMKEIAINNDPSLLTRPYYTLLSPLTGSFLDASAGLTNYAYCTDMSNLPTEAQLTSEVNKLAQKYPLIGAFKATLYGVMCMGTPLQNKPVTPQSPQHKIQSAPVLVVNNTYDPNTPYVMAQQTQSVLNNSRLLTREGYGHTIFFTAQNETCVADSELNYLLYLELPEVGKTCKGAESPFN